MSKVSYCAAQADIWSSRRMHGYFGLAVSYILDGKMSTRLVACRRFTGSHTGENIASLFVALVDEFNVRNKITAVVTDNAANMKKAFEQREREREREFYSQLHCRHTRRAISPSTLVPILSNTYNEQYTKENIHRQRRNRQYRKKNDKKKTNCLKKHCKSRGFVCKSRNVKQVIPGSCGCIGWIH